MLKNLAIVTAIAVAAGGGWAAYETQSNCSKWSAYEAIKDRLKADLKNPDGAVFPSYFKVSITSDESLPGICQYEISSHFDGQNSFGAMIRHEYTARTTANKTTPPEAFVMSLRSR